MRTLALVKAGKMDEPADNYFLVEEIHRETDKTGSSQRVLSQNENVLHAQSRWKGSGRFLLRKKSGGEQGMRLWTSNATREQKILFLGYFRFHQRFPNGVQRSPLLNVLRPINLPERREGSLMSDASPDWDSQLFLVCVHNVDVDQPYTIIQAPTSSCAHDIVTQALSKSRRAHEAKNYVLCEEVPVTAFGPSGNECGGTARSHLYHQQQQQQQQGAKTSIRWRVLADDENVHTVQSAWKNATGQFTLIERHKVTESKLKRESKSFLHRFSLNRAPSFSSEKTMRLLRQSEDDNQLDEKESGHRPLPARLAGYRHLWDWRTTSRSRDSGSGSGSPQSKRLGSSSSSPFHEVRAAAGTAASAAVGSTEDIAMVDVRPSTSTSALSRMKNRIHHRVR